MVCIWWEHAIWHVTTGSITCNQACSSIQSPYFFSWSKSIRNAFCWIMPDDGSLKTNHVKLEKWQPIIHSQHNSNETSKLNLTAKNAAPHMSPSHHPIQGFIIVLVKSLCCYVPCWDTTINIMQCILITILIIIQNFAFYTLSHI